MLAAMDPTCPLISVLDDEQQYRKALPRPLKTHGFDVVTFTRGGEFLQACALRVPNCLLLDLRMPGLTGY
jgi:FixJ family two-component response regulator